jgi:hypothetical protein
LTGVNLDRKAENYRKRVEMRNFLISGEKAGKQKF